MTKIVEAFGLKDANATNLPLTNSLLNETFGEPMCAEEASRYRGLAARANYAAQDRPDLSLVSAVAASHMAAPPVGAEQILKKMARYLVGRESAVNTFEWQEMDKPKLTLHTDSDWATEV